jgi:transcriptional regulator with XRE-family HTH domain
MKITVSNTTIDYVSIGNNIRLARKAKGLTQDGLAELVDLSTNHISHIEIGTTSLSLEALLRICEALDVTADYLLYNNLTKINPALLSAQIEHCFHDASARETKLMLAVATAAKDALRSNNL